MAEDPKPVQIPTTAPAGTPAPSPVDGGDRRVTGIISEEDPVFKRWTRAVDAALADREMELHPNPLSLEAKVAFLAQRSLAQEQKINNLEDEIRQLRRDCSRPATGPPPPGFAYPGHGASCDPGFYALSQAPPQLPATLSGLVRGPPATPRFVQIGDGYARCYPL